MANKQLLIVGHVPSPNTQILRDAVERGANHPEISGIDATAELGRLGLNDHLSAQRSNGLRAMVQRIRDIAAAAAAG